MFCVFQRCGLKRPRSVFFLNERDTGKTTVGYGQTSLSFQPADQTNISPNTRGESLRNWDTDACSLWRCLTIKKLWNFQYLPTAGQPGPGKGELSEEVASKYGANGWVIVLDSCGLTNRYLVPYEHVYRSADTSSGSTAPKISHELPAPHPTDRADVHAKKRQWDSFKQVLVD